MTTSVQRRRGTTTQHNTFTGLEGEITIDTTKDTAVVHDGSTVGGFPLAKETLENAKTTNLTAIVGSATAADDTFLIYDTSASAMKKITRAELNNAIEVDALANVTITGGTINGTSVGATTASTGRFSTLEATGVSTFSAGTVSAPAITTTGDTNTGIYFPAADTIAFTEGGVESMRINANGNVGIGLTSPDVYGSRTNLYVAGSLGGALILGEPAKTFQAVVLGDFNNGVMDIGTLSNHAVKFISNSTERMRITSAGNVGIGTSSPAYNLEVSGSTTGAIAAGITNTNAAGYSQLYLRNTGTSGKSYLINVGGNGAIAGLANNFIIYDNTAAATRLTIDTSGNLGLGVTSSAWQSNFKVIELGFVGSGLSTNASAKTILASNYYFNSGDKFAATGFASLYQQNNGSHYWGSSTASGTANAAITFTSGMTLDASGNLLVGTTTNTNSSRLVVNGTASETVSSTQYLVASQYDVGTAPNKIPLNQYLGTMAYQDSASVNITGGVVDVSAGTAALPSLGTTGDENTGVFFPAADTIAASTNGVERMRIDSSGNVGLGVTPSAWSGYTALQVGAAGAIWSSSTSNTWFSSNTWNDGTNFKYLNTAAATGYRQNAGQHGWWNAPSGTAGNAITFTQAMTLDASGNLLVGITSARANAGDVQVSKGISFPATQSAQSDANTLDDYEEGAWTPAYAFSTSGSVTQSLTEGKYVKVGSVVHLTCRIATSAISSPAGNVTITGLPFTSAASSNYGVAIGQASSFATDMPLRARLGPSSSTINVFKNTSNNASSFLLGSDFGAGVSNNLLDFTLTYIAA